ncbi:condensation domain-containing protein, partial [Pseudomonas laurylsulfatiphila]|uniref:condensation domain-containing protein n=1 Tax=Pseudomonas laurylsulfatiphila TaxID=2011015 RepID=UPI003D0CEF21
AQAVRSLGGSVPGQSFSPIGPTSLVPVQRWFEEQALVNADHWCLGTAIEIQRSFPADTLKVATQRILERYPVLNAQFTVSADGYTQSIPARPVAVQMSCKTVQLTSAIDQSLDYIEDTLKGALQSLDLATGDLFRIVLFRTPDAAPDLVVLLALLPLTEN